MKGCAYSKGHFKLSLLSMESRKALAYTEGRISLKDIPYEGLTRIPIKSDP
jgi:hypothetical protein